MTLGSDSASMNSRRTEAESVSGASRAGFFRRSLVAASVEKPRSSSAATVSAETDDSVEACSWPEDEQGVEDREQSLRKEGERER